MTRLRRDALAAKAAHRLSDEGVRIRGAWRTSYAIELAPNSSRLHLHYVIVQTESQGCCYYEPAIEEPGVSEALLRRDAVADDLGGGAWQIAALDAVYAGICRGADERIILSGGNVEKATTRADVVCAEVDRLLSSTSIGDREPRVANVGVVGDFLGLLARRGDRLSLMASDYYQRIVGTDVNGVTVEHGSMTPRLVAEADVAIVTGMTLATGTLDAILQVARESSTAVVVFAQTGANFAEVYLEYGAATVVAEPPPFYLTGNGPSEVNVFRAR